MQCRIRIRFLMRGVNSYRCRARFSQILGFLPFRLCLGLSRAQMGSLRKSEQQGWEEKTEANTWLYSGIKQLHPCKVFDKKWFCRGMFWWVYFVWISRSINTCTPQTWGTLWNRICVKLKPICVIIAHMNLKFNHPLQYIFTVVDCLSQLHDR